jgi:hypothetical protein
MKPADELRQPQPSLSAGRWALRRPRSGHHRRRRRHHAAPAVQRHRNPLMLPNGTALAQGPRPCQSKPGDAPSLLIPEAGDQAPQHQTYPHEPEKHHSLPVVGWVWCNVPAVVEGYRSASHHQTVARSCGPRFKNYLKTHIGVHYSNGKVALATDSLTARNAGPLFPVAYYGGTPGVRSTKIVALRFIAGMMAHDCARRRE